MTDARPVEVIAPWPGVQPRLLTDTPRQREDAAGYASAGGYSWQGRAETLLDAVTAVGLRGHGGAGFPTAQKLRSVAAQGVGRTVRLVANGAESEPASCKDRWLMRRRPHLVLDGARIAAEAVGAERIDVFVTDELAADSLRQALQEVEPRLPTGVVSATDTYVAGEETAVVRAVSGGRALPTDKPPRPYQSGVDGVPTAVVNVETLAHLALVATHGADEYLRGPSFLATVISSRGAPALLELPVGLPLGELYAGRVRGGDAPSGVLMGGFFGGIMPLRAELALEWSAVREAGSSMGCGSFAFLDGADDCPVACAADVIGFFATDNAAQCGPCIRGTLAARGALLALARGTASAQVRADFARWGDVLPGRGACAVPDGVSTLLRSLLRWYSPLLDDHLAAPCARCDGHQPITPRTRFHVQLAD